MLPIAESATFLENYALGESVLLKELGESVFKEEPGESVISPGLIASIMPGTSRQ